jgi:hypothetical protein
MYRDKHALTRRARHFLETHENTYPNSMRGPDGDYYRLSRDCGLAIDRRCGAPSGVLERSGAARAGPGPGGTQGATGFRHIG